MRRIIYFLIVLFVSLNIKAQSDHFTFMGIPIDGKVSKFEKELKKKGFCVVPYGKEIKGVWIYNGIFAGEVANVYVAFEEKTKIVFRVSIIIKCFSEEEVTSKYENIRDMIYKKYSENEGVRFINEINALYKEELEEKGIHPFKWVYTIPPGENNKYEKTEFNIPTNDGKDFLGEIIISSGEATYDDPSYNLYIVYTDKNNEELVSKNIIDDL